MPLWAFCIGKIVEAMLRVDAERKSRKTRLARERAAEAALGRLERRDGDPPIAVDRTEFLELWLLRSGLLSEAALREVSAAAAAAAATAAQATAAADELQATAHAAAARQATAEERDRLTTVKADTCAAELKEYGAAVAVADAAAAELRRANASCAAELSTLQTHANAYAAGGVREAAAAAARGEAAVAGYYVQRWWAAFAAFCNTPVSAPWHAFDAQWRVRSAAAAASDAARPPPPSPSIALLPARVALWTWVALLVLLLHSTWRRRALGKARREEDELRAALEAELAAVRGGLAEDLASEVLARLVAPQYGGRWAAAQPGLARVAAVAERYLQGCYLDRDWIQGRIVN